jgi:hypothetical protein
LAEARTENPPSVFFKEQVMGKLKKPDVKKAVSQSLTQLMRKGPAKPVKAAVKMQKRVGGRGR